MMTLQSVKISKEVSVEETLPADILYQRSISQLVLDWTKDLVTILQGDYDRQYGGYPNRYQFAIKTGRKYYKIHDGNGVHAFIDKKTGQVYKPASWKQPAPYARYDLRILEDRARCYNNADWACGYLYIRG